ncbi:hypothetical protein BGZ94_003608 [Podila epigama]|nr:hypothetical protein BGZ94_003608 [Podila epigama]
MSTIINQNQNLTAVDDLQLTALGINLGTNVALSLFTLAAFCWLRPRNGVIYAKKYKYSSEEKRAPKLDEGYFSWMSPVWSCPDDVLVDKIGLDAVVFIRFIRMCRQVFMAMAVIGCGALLPINAIATLRAMPEGETPKDKIGMLSIKGIEDLRWLWGHVGAIWMFSGILMFAMYHGYITFLKYRIQYFESEAYQENMASRTLMLAGLPTSLQSDEKLSAFMGSLGMKDQPVQALVGRKVDKLPELMDKHKEMVTSLEKVMAKYFADPNNLPAKRPTVRLGKICGTKVDAIDYYSQQIEELTDQIEKTRSEISKSQPTNYGFVSYATINAAHRVARELSNPIVLRQRSKMIDPPELFLSPVPKDIIWFNVSNPKQLRKSRRVIVNTLFVIGSILFFIPMGFLTTFAKLDRFIGLVPSTKPFFERNPFVTGLLQSLLPILFMDILFMIIRKLITFLAFFQGNITKSSTDRSTLAKFYLFFTVNNLIIFALSGTIIGFFAQIKLILSNFDFSSATWDGIKDFIAKQDNIVALLSQNVIDSSLFWVNYMSLRNFGALLDLFQLVSLFFYWVKTTVTPRENKAMEKPGIFDFPTFFSAHMFLLTVALLYSVVAPLVLFFAVIYFSLASLVYKYQLMYVFRTKVETGGRLFRVVYNRLLVALVLFQVVMIGILNLKQAHKHSLAVLPLPLLTILFKLFLSKNYDPKIDFYDYGSARNESHLFKNSSGSNGKNGGPNKGNSLLLNFENPVFQSKMISALVPEGAKKMLSSKVLHGGRDHLDQDKKKPKASTLAYGKTSMSHDRPSHQQQHQYQSQQQQQQKQQHSSSKYQQNSSSNDTYEMGHMGRSAKSSQKFQVLGSDPMDYNDHNTVSSPRTLSSRDQRPRYDYQSPQSLGDDPLDDYFDDQKQSLTQSAAAQPVSAKVYGAQDMTSFVAGRYTERPSNSNNYNSKGNVNSGDGGSGSGGQTKPSYLELAKMHQTESYKTTGKATQYEDTNALQALHLPPINFSKMQSRQQTRGGHEQQSQQSPESQQPPQVQQPQQPQQPVMIEDPFYDPQELADRQQYNNHSTALQDQSQTDNQGSYRSKHQNEYQNECQPSTGAPVQSSRSPRMPKQAPLHSAPRRIKTEPTLHTSTSSPSLRSNYSQQNRHHQRQFSQQDQYDVESSSPTSPRSRHLTRAQTTTAQYPSRSQQDGGYSNQNSMNNNSYTDNNSYTNNNNYNNNSFNNHGAYH